MTPVLAETPVNVNDRAHILRCSEQSVGNYRVFLQESLEDMRSAIRSQWRRQADFRIRAAAVNRRTSVTSALRVAETQLETALAQFVTTQQNGINADVSATVDIFARQNEAQEEAGLEQWTNRSVSFQALDAALARSERTLRTYASTRDRAIITRVWNDTRRQVENAFSQAREETRGVFVEDMNSCIYGEMADVEQDDAQTTTSDNNEPLSNNAATTPAFVVNDIKVDAVYGALSACSQRITFRSQIQGNHRGEMRGYFLYSDGQRSENMTGVTNATGFVALQHTRSLTAADNSPLNIRAKFIVTGPTQKESPEFPVTVVCAPDSANQQQPPLRAEATVAVQGPSTIRTCGSYPFSFQGTITSNAAGVVQYYWLRSDGSRSTTASVTFDRAGSKTVSYEWPLTAAANGFTGSVQLVIVSPNVFSSPPASLSLAQAVSCAGSQNNNTNTNNEPTARAEAAVRLDGPSTITTCGTYPFTFSGTITSNVAGSVSYYWMRNDGQRSPTQTVNFSGAGTRNVGYEWPLSGDWSGSLKLIITSPNQLESSPATFILVQASACAGGQNTSTNTSNNNEAPLRAEATLNVLGPTIITTCTQYPFTFQGTISLNRAGTVTYYWLHEDGTHSENISLSFYSAGTQSVSHQWTAQTASSPYTGSVRLMIIDPNITNAQASFTLSRAVSCAGNQSSSTNTLTSTDSSSSDPAVTAVTATLDSPSNVTACGAATFAFKGTISVNRTTEVRYQWERSNGLTSPVQTLSFEGPGNRTVTDTWVTEARNLNSFARLHVLSPNDMMSGNANFTLTQSCS